MDLSDVPAASVLVDIYQKNQERKQSKENLEDQEELKRVILEFKSGEKQRQRISSRLAEKCKDQLTKLGYNVFSCVEGYSDQECWIIELPLDNIPKN